MSEADNEILRKMHQYSKAEINFVGDILDFTQIHLERFLVDIKYFTQEFEIAFDTIVLAIESVNFEKKDARPSQRSTQFLMITNNLQTLYSSFHLLSSGFYTDSILTVRSLFETIVRIFYSEKHPDDLDSIIIKQKGSGFKITNFLSKEIDQSRADEYKLLSFYAHSNSIKTIKDLISISKEGQKNLIAYQQKYDFAQISICVSRIYFILRNYTYFIAEYLIKDNKEQYQKLSDIGNGILARLHIIKEGNPINLMYDRCISAKVIYDTHK